MILKHLTYFFGDLTRFDLQAGLIAEDEAISPDKIKKKWQELVGGAWMRNKKIKSTCYNRTYQEYPTGHF